jgi:hypothetical protein
MKIVSAGQQSSPKISKQGCKCGFTKEGRIEFPIKGRLSRARLEAEAEAGLGKNTI